MYKKILITGATGLIGSELVKKLNSNDILIYILTTNPGKAQSLFQKLNSLKIIESSHYSTPEKLKEIIEDTQAVINLAGTNVSGKRWSAKFKKEIYSSRIETTKLIVDAIKLGNRKPECLINASGVGFYGFHGDEILNEKSDPGTDFLAALCRDWEEEALKAVNSNVRVVTMRTGIVLSSEGGALKEFLTPFRFGFGVYQGSGMQWLSWIHIDDIIKLYVYALNNEKLIGALNGTTPNPVTNKEFTGILAEVLRKKLILPVPEVILKLVIGEFSKNLTTGQRVYPEKALFSGFKFDFPYLKEALINLLNSH